MKNALKPRLLLFVSLLIALAFSAGVSSAQGVCPQEADWEKTFDVNPFDEGRSVQQTSDGGYIIAGYTRPEAGGWGDVCLIKADADGNQDWQKTFGGDLDDVGYSVQQTTDGGYIIAGYTYSYGTGGDVYLIKTDSSGNLAWQKTFGGASSDGGYSVQQTTDGGYIIAGYTYSYGGWCDVYLIKTDSSGNLTWQKNLGRPGGIPYPYLDYGHSVQQTSDGGYIIAGYTYSWGGPPDVYLVKTDASGNLAWQKTFGGTSYDYGYSVQQTSDSGYVIAGQTSSFGKGSQVYLIKTDASGNLAWQNNFGGDSSDRGYSVQQASDGGYVVVGQTSSFSDPFGDVYLLKTDPSGNQECQNIFGRPNSSDMGYAVAKTSDDGYVIAGYTYVYGDAWEDVYLIKLKPVIRIEATIDIDPDTLILRSNGKWLTCYIELPEGYNVADIDVSTIMLEGEVPAITDSKYGFTADPNAYLTDHDGDGILERMVKFDREAAAGVLAPGEEVELTVTGRLPENVLFEGQDTIRVQ